MTWVVMTIPDDPVALAGWLEAQLVGPELGRLAAELRAVRPPRNPPPRLDEVLGPGAAAVLRGGLGGLPPTALRALLRNPDLLLDLQEFVQLEGGRYWSDLPAGERMTRAVARGWDRLRATAELNNPAPARGAGRPPAARLLPYALTNLATAAVVLLGAWAGLSARRAADREAAESAVADLTRERDEARAAAERAGARSGRNGAVGWGWQRADAVPADVTRADYLGALADRAEEWFRERPDTPEGLARRLGEFRQGCSALLLDPHVPLPGPDREWLRERCRAWSQRFDEYLARVEQDRDTAAPLAAADGTVRQLVAALRNRAAAG